MGPPSIQWICSKNQDITLTQDILSRLFSKFRFFRKSEDKFLIKPKYCFYVVWRFVYFVSRSPLWTLFPQVKHLYFFLFLPSFIFINSITYRFVNCFLQFITTCLFKCTHVHLITFHHIYGARLEILLRLPKSWTLRSFYSLLEDFTIIINLFQNH